MREYDDDNISHYAPVLRRIIILVAVITAVPVMLWTITAFMHTYIAQPTIPSPQPLAAATAPPASPAADTANPPAPSQPAPSVTDARASDDGAGNNAAPNVQVASTATISPAPSAAPSCRSCRSCRSRRSGGDHSAGSARRTLAQRIPGPASCRTAAANACRVGRCK